MINAKTRKLIKKYVKSRAGDQPQYDVDIFLDIYDKADAKKRKQFRDEMNKYFDAIKKGEIKEGQAFPTVRVSALTPADN